MEGVDHISPPLGESQYQGLSRPHRQGTMWDHSLPQKFKNVTLLDFFPQRLPQNDSMETVHMVSCYEIHDEEDNSKPSPKYIPPFSYMSKKLVQRLARRHDTMKVTNGLNQEGEKFPPWISVFNHIKASSFSPLRISAVKSLSVVRPTQNQNVLACSSAFDRLGAMKASIIGCSQDQIVKGPIRGKCWQQDTQSHPLTREA